MIVHKLTEIEKKQISDCYSNMEGSACSSFLKKEFDADYNENTKVVTLSKQINDGSVKGKNENGVYTNGLVTEVRHVHLSSVSYVQAPEGKSFFTQWSDDDWKKFDKSVKSSYKKLESNLGTDSRLISSNTANIMSVDSRNTKIFLKEKEAKEKADSLLQDLALAYFTGGMAGVKASIKGQIESTINTELATAFIRATGGSEDDIAFAAQAVQFMRGRMKMRDLKDKNTYVGYGSASGLDFLNPLTHFKVTGQVINATAQHLGSGLTKTLHTVNNWTGGTTNMALGVVTSIVSVVGNLLVGSENYSRFVDNITAKDKKYAALKASEEALARRAASQGIASASGLPLDLVSSWVNDKVGEAKAEKANKFAGNFVLDISTQIVGLIGGIVKTALVATGIKEREIQKTLAQGNDLVNLGNMERSSATNASLGFNEQIFGMKATGTSFQSSVIDIKNNKAAKEELNKLVIASNIASATGIRPDIARGFVDKGFSDHDRRKADRDAQRSAIEQTLVTAATIVVTMGCWCSSW